MTLPGRQAQPDPQARTGRQARKALARKHLDRKIRIRLRLYALLFMVLLGVVAVELVVVGAWAILPVLACLAGGIVAGRIASRMFRLEWDSAARNVVGKVDVIGGVILLAYIAFTVFRGRIVGMWVPASIAGMCSLAVLAGAMFGQVLGTVGGIKDLVERLRSPK
ncbi:hypothetical protein BIU82_12250 [Arthrobacter sp. SW1]|uniref:hypothetical protein n=1 Tax=Arthrobacter sp. SW1 TaxID=1920889 RepID=UPI000877DC6A|nr:hypothetical protein [Arthrobacter sp. SW1]OFI36831.1 hypothetical protein BIU82_12250 [Arthrobacter sp. SW1]